MPKNRVPGPLVIVKESRTGSKAISPSVGWSLKMSATNTGRELLPPPEAIMETTPNIRIATKETNLTVTRIFLFI
jgi:hypothetical protein